MLIRRRTGSPLIRIVRHRRSRGEGGIHGPSAPHPGAPMLSKAKGGVSACSFGDEYFLSGRRAANEGTKTSLESASPLSAGAPCISLPGSSASARHATLKSMDRSNRHERQFNGSGRRKSGKFFSCRRASAFSEPHSWMARARRGKKSRNHCSGVRLTKSVVARGDNNDRGNCRLGTNSVRLVDHCYHRHHDSLPTNGAPAG